MNFCTKNPIICAIDTNDFDNSIQLIKEIHDSVYSIKLGLEFFMAFGIDGVKRIIELFPEIKIFLDLKFHDIPNTVGGALKSIVKIDNIFLTTIHASGGDEMIKRACEIVKDSNSNLKIIAVTKLTSLELIESDVVNLTELALKNGAHGVVCPPDMSRILRNKFDSTYKDFTIVTPGIRLIDKNINNDDQKSIATPKKAIENGSSYLVIGRPITQAFDKKAIIKKILHNF